MFPGHEQTAAGEKEGHAQDDERAGRKMLRGQQADAVKRDPEHGQLDGMMNHQRQHGGGEKGGGDAGQGALHAGGEEGFPGPDGPARKEDPIGETGKDQDDDPDDQELGGRERMIPVMLGVVGGGKTAKAEQPADEGGGSRDGAVNGGPFHQGTDDAELLAGIIGIGHFNFVPQSHGPRNLFFWPGSPTLFPVGAVKEPEADDLKKNVRRPDDQFGIEARVALQRASEYAQEIIDSDDQKREEDTPGGLPPLRLNRQRDADDDKGEGGDGKSDARLKFREVERGRVARRRRLHGDNNRFDFRQRHPGEPPLHGFVKTFERNGLGHLVAMTAGMDLHRIPVARIFLLAFVEERHHQLLVLQVQIDPRPVGPKRSRQTVPLAQTPENDVVELGPLLFCEINAPARNLVDDDLRVQQGHRIVGHNLMLHLVEFLLTLGNDGGDQPEVERAQEKRKQDDRRDDGSQGDTGRLEGQQFAVRRHSTENNKHRREQPRRNGQRQRQRYAQQHELGRQPHRQIAAHE